jgi:hypothetical protein
MKQVKVINDELALNTVVAITTCVGNESQEEVTSEDHRQQRNKELADKWLTVKISLTLV